VISPQPPEAKHTLSAFELSKLVSHPLYFVLVCALVLLLITTAAANIWKYSQQQQLQELKQSALRHIELYSSKVLQQLGQTQQSLLPVIGNHPSIKAYLSQPSVLNRLQAQNHLNSVLNSMPNRTIFIGNAKQLLLAAEDAENDLLVIESVKKTINSRSFTGKNSEQFIFSPQSKFAKFMVAIPIKDNETTLGYIGLLLDISALQNELNQALPNKQEIILISDEHGIIMLSSEPSWLYKSFSNLPYNVKKSIDPQFEQKKQFAQLGIVNIDEGILTTDSNNVDEQSQSFLVHSSLLAGRELRLHHLANIAEVSKNSNTYASYVVLFGLVISIIWLFLQEIVRAQQAKKTLAIELKARDIEFRQQQKLASLGMMATTIAHELNQPITAIKTEANLGKKHLEQSNVDETKVSLQAIIEYTRLLASITTQLKDFARKRKKTNYLGSNIEQAIKQSYAMHKSRMTEEKVTCQISKIDQQLLGNIDEYQLQQVISNLLQNACDAMLNSQEKNISIEVTNSVSHLFIIVSDTGVGIKDEDKGSIFDPFVSNKINVSSMGLGLAICHDLLDKVGGNIELIANKSKDAPGATFKVTIPIYNSNNPIS